MMRRSTAWLIAGLALMSIGAAHAGTLYVCEGPNGVKAYQDKPCPAKAKTVGTGTFKSTPYTPSPRPPPPDPAEVAPDVSPQRMAPQPRVAEAVADPTPVGWICEAGQRRWLQFSPCPATYMRAAPVHVDGIIADTGSPMYGTGTIRVPAPVQSTPLNRSGVCAALGDRSIRVPHSGSSDVYERNKFKAKYCY